MTYDTRIYSGNDIGTNFPMQCLRWRKKLVYVRTLKCGSEFFWNNFSSQPDWHEIAFKDINWRQNLVFSYIMDPIQRRHKGVAEWLRMNTLVKQFYTQTQFQQILNSVPFFDEHSASLEILYGSHLYDIEWIPLMASRPEVAISATEQLLHSHDHPAIEWNHDFAHRSPEYFRQLYLRVKQHWDENDIQRQSARVFHEDIKLWQRVCKRYNLDPHATI